MPTNLLILPLLGGFVFVRMFAYTRFATSKLTGQKLIIWAALAGVILMVISRVLILLFGKYYPPLGIYWQSVVFPGAFTGTATLAFGLGCLAWWPLNHLLAWWPLNRLLAWWPLNRLLAWRSLNHFLAWWTLNYLKGTDYAYQRSLRLYGDEFEKLFGRSIGEDKQVLVTLSGGKSYVGHVVSLPANSWNESAHFKILPTFTGYREANTKKLHLITDYIPIYDELWDKISAANSKLNLQDFEKHLKFSDVESASIYDPNTFSLFEKPPANDEPTN